MKNFLIILGALTIAFTAVTIGNNMYLSYKNDQHKKQVMRNFAHPENHGPKIPTRQTIQITPTPPQNPITLNKFLRLTTGMSYAQTCAILEVYGTLASESELGYGQYYCKTQMYAWSNPGVFQGNMNAMFQNDRLVSKAQFGLK